MEEMKMKVTIISKLTNEVLAENDEVTVLTHDKKHDKMKVNNITLNDASSYNIIIEL